MFVKIRNVASGNQMIEFYDGKEEKEPSHTLKESENGDVALFTLYTTQLKSCSYGDCRSRCCGLPNF